MPVRCFGEQRRRPLEKKKKKKKTGAPLILRAEMLNARKMRFPVFDFVVIDWSEDQPAAINPPSAPAAVTVRRPGSIQRQGEMEKRPPSVGGLSLNVCK